MDRRISISILMIILLMLPSLVSSAENKIPREGTIFVGENDLDISDCNVRTGDEIAWWRSGSPQGIPDARAKIGDTRRFFVDPTLFSSHTGTWYGLISKETAFKVEDPWIQLEVVENGIDREKEWIKRGNLVSFRIATNMYALSERTGSAGVPIKISLTGPNETVYQSLISPQGNYNLEKIFAYYSPYDTGVAWDTKNEKKYPDGEYKISAEIMANDIREKNDVGGATYTDDIIFTLSSIKPGEKEDSKSEEDSDDTSEESTQKPTKEPTLEPTREITPDPTTIPPTQEPTPEITFEEPEIIPTKTPYPLPPTPSAKSQPLSPMISGFAILGAFILAIHTRGK